MHADLLRRGHPIISLKIFQRRRDHPGAEGILSLGSEGDARLLGRQEVTCLSVILRRSWASHCKAWG